MASSTWWCRSLDPRRRNFAADFFGKRHPHEDRMKSAFCHLNHHKRDGQLVEGASLLREVTARRRRLEGGYAQKSQTPNKTAGQNRAKRPAQREDIGSRRGASGNDRLARLRADSLASLPDFHGSRRRRWQRLVRLVRGRAAAIERSRAADRLIRSATEIAVSKATRWGMNTPIVVAPAGCAR